MKNGGALRARRPDTGINLMIEKFLDMVDREVFTVGVPGLRDKHLDIGE